MWPMSVSEQLKCLKTYLVVFYNNFKELLEVNGSIYRGTLNNFLWQKGPIKRRCWKQLLQAMLSMTLLVLHKFIHNSGWPHWLPPPHQNLTPDPAFSGNSFRDIFLRSLPRLPIYLRVVLSWLSYLRVVLSCQQLVMEWELSFLSSFSELSLHVSQIFTYWWT